MEDEYEGLNVTGVKTDTKQICRLIMLICIFYCLFELHLQTFPVHNSAALPTSSMPDISECGP